MSKLSKTFYYGAAALAAGALMFAVPKAAHAVVATLVQVANTSASPVPNKDVDNAARHPFAASCYATGQGSQGAISCYPTPLPPAGSQTVIQNMSFLVYRPSGTGTPAETYFSFVTGGQSYQYYVPFVTQINSSPNTGYWVGSQAVNIYEDQGSFPQCSAGMGDFATQVQMACTVTGYTVSLP
jgi:hypothetical protein